MSHTINTSPIRTPTQFETETFFIEQSTRLASGKLVIDRRATKRIFRLSYNEITGTELSTILSALTAPAFVTYGFPAEIGTDTATVKVGNIPRELWFNLGAKRLRNVSLELIEQ